MSAKCGLLIVEDDVAIREGLARILKAEHYSVFIASCLDEAVSAYNSNPIGLVLLDIHLGQEDGWDVFRALKKLNPDLPIIVTSAQPERLLNPSAVPCGVLEKPFEMPDLLALLSAVLFAHTGDMAKTKPCPCPRSPARRLAEASARAVA
jgi:DNA-binding response OmpR family regulator